MRSHQPRLTSGRAMVDELLKGVRDVRQTLSLVVLAGLLTTASAQRPVPAPDSRHHRENCRASVRACTRER